MVLVHHYSYVLDASLTHGHLHALHNGVDLFFVITGYLFAPYVLGQSRQHPLAFGVRRVFRLYPLYLCSLLLGVAVLWGERAGLGMSFLKHLLFVQALPGQPLSEVGLFSLVYWTLPVEVMFYLLVAGVMVLGLRRGSTDLRLLSLGLAAFLAYGLSHGHAQPGQEQWVLWQAQLPALLPQFWFGLCLYRFGPSLARGAWALGAVGAVLLAYLLASYAEWAAGSLTARPFGHFNLLSGLSYALLLGAALGLCAGRTDGLVARWACRAGALSYAVYLFHEWCLLLAQRHLPMLAPSVQVGVAFGAVLLGALVLHRTVEAPLRRLGRRLARRWDDDAAANPAA